MTQEDKELLLVDLCARSPYGVKCKINDYSELYYLSGTTHVGCYFNFGSVFESLEDFKPYLRPMGSMTGEEKKEFHHIASLQRNYLGDDIFYTHWQMYDWLNKNMFDYRGLIVKGLALKAPEGMYDIKEK